MRLRFTLIGIAGIVVATSGFLIARDGGCKECGDHCNCDHADHCRDPGCRDFADRDGAHVGRPSGGSTLTVTVDRHGTPTFSLKSEFSMRMPDPLASIGRSADIIRDGGRSGGGPSFSGIANTPSPSSRSNGPNVPSLSSGGYVEVCRRAAHFSGGNLLATIGIYHEWFAIRGSKGELMFAPGLGDAKGVPGVGGEGVPGAGSLDTYVVDHKKESTENCEVLRGVDPECVVALAPLGKPDGLWVPGIHDCNTFVEDIANACAGPEMCRIPTEKKR